MKIPKRRPKTAASKTVILLAFYMALMDCSSAIPVSWLEKACKSKVCCHRYINELKELIFGDSLYYAVETVGDRLIAREKVSGYKSNLIGVDGSFRENPVYKFDEVVSRGVTPNKKAHIERMQRLIALNDRLDEYSGFDLSEHMNKGYDGNAIYTDDDWDEESDPFPDAKHFLKYLSNDYYGLTSRSLQRDLIDLKDAKRLYKKIMNDF